MTPKPHNPLTAAGAESVIRDLLCVIEEGRFDRREGANALSEAQAWIAAYTDSARRVTDTEVEAARDTIRRSYVQHVDACAADFVERCKKGEFADGAELSDAIREAHQYGADHYSIYTAAGLECLLASDNDQAALDAYREYGSGAGECPDSTGELYCTLAGEALILDVTEEIARLGVDLNDPTGETES